MVRVLFILKKRSSYGISYGLRNSCQFVCNALEKNKIECKVVEVIDGNYVDKEVFNYKPTHVVIEAYWVTGAKLDTLLQKYPNIFWTVRSHSKIPFFQNEGICIDFTKDYNNLKKKYKNFSISSNTFGFINPVWETLKIKVDYLPNIYSPKEYDLNPYSHNNTFINIGCFSAIRPQKNILLQAMAAISFSDDLGKKLRFHILADRIEQKGEPILKNVINLFNDNNHDLICHNWMNHEDFIKLVRTMDLGMQVSNSESFNIVAADFVWNDIPIVGSPEIEWMNWMYKADPNDFFDIKEKLKFIWSTKKFNLQYLNKHNLIAYNKLATKVWLNYLK